MINTSVNHLMLGSYLASMAVLFLFLCLLFWRVCYAMQLRRNEEAQLKIAMLKLEQMSRNKSEFLAHLSHELRTPINAILGFSDLLRNGCLGNLSKEQSEYLCNIYSSGAHMLSLVNNILDLSKIEAGKMPLDIQPVELSELLDGGIFMIREQAASNRVHIHLDVQHGVDVIHVDPLKTRQILYNLLSNAVKFAPAGGRLQLRVRYVPRSDVGRVSGRIPSRIFPLSGSDSMSYLEISVADSGPGIPCKELARLFRAYSQIGNDATHQSGGTGLGLMLVKRLTELHGGTVAVESMEGQGSRFIVWLPLGKKVWGETAKEPLPVSKTSGTWQQSCAEALVGLGLQRTDFYPTGRRNAKAAVGSEKSFLSSGATPTASRQYPNWGNIFHIGSQKYARKQARKLNRMN